MKDALRVLKRDYLRLLKAPAALVVVAVLIILPSLYTWFNVVGFWDPYGHTNNIRVCVVNQDDGAHLDLTDQDIDLGSMVVEQLEENDQLGWTFTDYDTAMEEVNSGKSYAAFVIPKDFSYDVTTFLTSDFTQPKLEYYVNEKAGGVSMKVTDTGANTLDETINSTFVSTVSGVIADTLDENLGDAKSDISKGKTSVAKQLNKASKSLENARGVVADLDASVDGLTDKVGTTSQNLTDSKSTISDLSKDLESASSDLSEVQDALSPFIVSLSSTLDESSSLASSAAGKANSSVAKAQSAISGAQGTVSSVVSQGKSLVSTNKTVLESLQSLVKQLPDGDQKDQVNQQIEDLKSTNSSLEATINSIDSVYKDLDSAASDVANASDKVNSALQGTLSSADEYRNVLLKDTLPQVNSGTTQLSNAISGLSAAVSNQQLLIDQSVAALKELSSGLKTTTSALSQTDGLLEGFQDDLDIVSTDLTALATSGVLADLMDDKGVDANKIADFMFSPTELETEELYSVNAYGSAMAPLFMNMSLWIGVFMLLVILRQETDDEGFTNLSSRARYLGKWLFLAPLVCLQAIVCCAGNLVLGVQAASVPLFFITAMLISLTYLCIQFTLSTLLQHIGKGLCIIFIFVQIPGATGLYPIEMTPDFFQFVYPLFPFTYGINALRETIAGFYGLQWLGLSGVLVAFLLVFLLLGLFLRPYFTNVNRMFSNAIAASDIFNGEEAELPARRYRMSQLFRVLADREEYRAELAENTKRFMRLYPKLKHAAVALGLGVPIVVTPILSLLGLEKVVILTMWLVTLVVILCGLVVLEFLRDRLSHEVALNDLSDNELRELFQARDGVSDSPAPLPVKLGRGKHSR